MINVTQEQALDLLAQCMRITAQGKYHAFFQYSGHVEDVYVYVNESSTDYQSGKYEYVFASDYPSAYESTKAALNALEAEA